MLSKFKLFVVLSVVLGFLAGCSSSGKKNDQEAADAALEADTTTQEVVEQADPWDGVVNVDSVFYFDFDQSILRPESRAALTVYARVLKEAPKAVRLEGHADERGSREYNMALGERRANAVRDFLVLQGVDGSLIETVSYGEERPAEVGSSEGSWAKNRRVELKY